MRSLIFSVGALAIISGSAAAHPEKTEKPSPTTSADFELPSQADINAAIDELPDFNAILGDMLSLVKNERLQKRMEKAGDAFTEKMDESGALEPDENGLPDIKLTLKTLMGAMSDEEVTGGVFETMIELQEIMDTHIPEDSGKVETPE